jgi:hypothetical protein
VIQSLSLSLVIPVARLSDEDFQCNANTSSAAAIMSIIIDSSGLFVFDKSQPQPTPRSARMRLSCKLQQRDYLDE